MDVLKLTRLALQNSINSFFILFVFFHFFIGLIEDWGFRLLGFYSSYLVINPRFFFVLFSSSFSALLIAAGSQIYWLVTGGIETLLS